MKSDKTKILYLLEPLVREENYLLVDIAVRGNEKEPVIVVFVDNETGITTKDCAKLSRLFRKKLEEELFPKGNFRLDVSSPGVDRPLKFLQQYYKHVGRKFRIAYVEEGKKKNFEGRLSSVEDDELTFVQNKKEVKIKFENIIKSKVLLDF